MASGGDDGGREVAIMGEQEMGWVKVCCAEENEMRTKI